MIDKYFQSMRVEQLGQLFERQSKCSSNSELYWIDSDGVAWQIAGHGIGEWIPQQVFWIPADARPVHHADPHLKKILKKIRFFEWFKENQAHHYFKVGKTSAKVYSINGDGQVWQHATAGLQRMFWLPENTQPLMA